MQGLKNVFQLIYSRTSFPGTCLTRSTMIAGNCQLVFAIIYNVDYSTFKLVLLRDKLLLTQNVLNQMQSVAVLALIDKPFISTPMYIMHKTENKLF